MCDDLSALNLQEDFERILQTPDTERWELVKPAPLEVWVCMSPVRAPEEMFQARLLWCVYPDEPPSLKFRDPDTGRLDLSKAWPQVRGFRPTSFDACVNWCKEGFALHPEWKNDPNLRWNAHGNVLLKVLRILQQELDDHYQGRHP